MDFIDDIIPKSDFRLESINDLYSLINSSCEDIIKSEKNFKNYLNVQSQFDKYSVGNALLILSQRPEATQLKEYNEWISIKNTHILKDEECIKLLKPKTSKKSNYSNNGFEVYKVFDISQTTTPLNINEEKTDDRMLLKSFLHKCPVKIKTEDNLQNDKTAMLSEDNELLYIQKGADTKNLFQDLATELAKIELADDGSKLDGFRSKCISYMICKKRGIDVSKYTFDDIPESYVNMSPKELREELNYTRNLLEKINDRMNYNVEPQTKRFKQRNYER